MNDFVDSFAYWLADYYLATTVLLVAALATMAFMKQPAKRIAVAKATLLSMVLLAALCALPGWSLVHFTTSDPPPQQPVTNAPVSTAGPPPNAPTELLTFFPSTPDAAAFSLPPVAPPHAALPWLAIALALYSLGSAATLIWFGIGMIFARRLLRDSTPATGEVEDILTTVFACERSRPRLRVSRQIDVAAALGIFRPTVLLPSSWAMERSASELRTVLAHECAHVRNGDLKWLAISRLASVVLWLQPLYWLIRRRMRLDQETLADAAAAELSSRVTYAEQLVAWARAVPSRPRPALASAVGLWESPSQLRRRVALLLDEHFPVLRECSRRLRWTSLLLCGFFALGLSVVTVQPTLSEPTEESSIPDRVVVGDQYVLCKVTTDLQRSLLGEVSKPDNDASACLMVNLSAFADEQLDAESPVLNALSIQLAKWAKDDSRGLRIRVYVPPKFGDEESAQREFATSFSQRLEKLARSAGYERAPWSRVDAGDFDWNQFILNAESLSKSVPATAERSVGNNRIQVFAVETFLSRLLVEADCVVNVLPTIEKSNAQRFLDDFQNDVKQFVPQHKYLRQEAMLLRTRCTDVAEQYLNDWADNRPAKVAYATQVGFKTCHLQRSYVADSDAKPTTADISGRVVLPDGTPAAGIPVTAYSMVDPDNLTLPQDYQRGTTDSEGRFQLSLYSGGKEVFWILPRDYVQQTHVINDRRGDLGSFQLTTGLYFHGRVIGKDAKPIGNIWVNAELVDGPAKQKIDMPVGDNIERAYLTNADGTFHLGPLPAGIYRVGPDEMPEDDFRNLDQSRRALPAAFLPQRLELTAASELEEIEIKPVDSVKIKVIFVDGQGHPTEGIGFFLIGTGPDVKRVAYKRGPVRRGNSPQVVSFDVPRGLTRTVLDFPRSSMRVRRSPTEPWKNDFSLDLGTLDRDWLEIEAVRYRTPTLVVTASDAAGNAIADFKPAIFYRYRDGQEPRKDRWIDDVRGDVDFGPGPNGGWQSEYLLPDEEFTLTVNADGYQPFEVKQSVLEGQRQEVDAVLRPLVATSDVSAADGQSLVADDEFAGVVTDESGKPLAGVTVDAWTWYPGNETTTDGDGHFTLKGFNAREPVEVQFTKAGFCPRLFVAEPVGKPDWVVALNSRTYLEGQVLDPAGRPVAGINLRATRGPFETPDGSQIGAVWTETETDSGGRYRIYLEPDTYELRVRRPGVGVARYEKVAVRENDRRDFDLQLETGPKFRAVVRDSVTNEPVAGIRLWNWQRQGIEGVSNADGALEVGNMPTGHYDFQIASAKHPRPREVAGDYARWWSPDALKEWQRLDLTDRGDGFQRNFDDLEFDVREGMQPVNILMERAVTIAGQVLDPDGKPVTGATVAPAKTGSGNSLTGDTRYSVKTGADGKFETRLPASGAAKYNLVAHDGGYEQWRAWANGVGELLQTKPGDRLEDVTLQLTRPSVVRGRVLDASGKPLANHPVRAQAVDKMENRYYDPTTKTDEHGEFELKFVRPGKHYIQADPFWLTVEDGPRGAWKLVDASPDRAVEGIELRVGEENQPTGTLNATLQELREKADQVRAASEDAKNGETKAQTQDTSVTIASGSVSFATKNPTTPWDYKPNVLAFAIQDETGAPVEGVEAVVYRVSLDTGDRSEVGRSSTDARGEVDFAELVEPKWAETLQEMVAKSQLLPEIRTIFYTKLRRDGMATVLLPASDYSVATTGIKRTVRMRPAAELSGRVTDRNGKPVAGALVAAGNLAGSVAIEGANAVRTDSEGRYRLSNCVAFNRAAGDQRSSARDSFAPAAQVDMSKMYPAIYDAAEDTSVSDLKVSHPDFAVTTVRGGDVPGSTDVVMQPNSTIVGRVVEFGTSKPVVGVRIKTVGHIEDAAANDLLHIASTLSDAAGEYRFNNLPTGNYEVWADEPSDLASKQERILRGLVDVAASAEKSPVHIADMVLGPGAIIRGRLIDGTTSKPLEQGDREMTVKVVTQLIDPFGNQGSPLRHAAVDREGRFSVQSIPGKSRVFLIVNTNEPSSNPQGDFRSADNEFEMGSVFDLKHGESVDTDFKVWSRAKIEEERAKQRSAANVPAKKDAKPNLLRDTRLAAAPILAEMAEKHGYGLAEKQVLRRIEPPFDPIRMKYYQVGQPSQAEAIPAGPDAMLFRWSDGKLTNWSMRFGPKPEDGFSLRGIFDGLVGIKDQYIDAPKALLDQRLPGDWVVRSGADEDALLKQLQSILQSELSLQVRFQFRSVPREIYVARGEYKLVPLPGHSGRDETHYENRTVVTDNLEIFAAQLIPQSGAGNGTGTFSEFLNALGNWIGSPVQSDAKIVPQRKLSWRYHSRSPFTAQMQAEDHDAALVLANITKQTGLTFTKETRPVRVLFIEETK